MIPFDESNPYPLLSFDAYSYQEAKDHAVLVDDWLGFECERAEALVRARTGNEAQNWGHLSSQAFQTPYVELRGILDLLKPQPGETLIDLGAAYGRLGFVMAAHYPETHFLGFEVEEARVVEAYRVMKRQGLPNAQVKVADLVDPTFSLPVADYYFIFDYGHEKDVRQTLENLRQVARHNPIQVVARGRLSRALIHNENPWLASVYQPMHFAHFSIYRS